MPEESGLPTPDPLPGRCAGVVLPGGDVLDFVDPQIPVVLQHDENLPTEQLGYSLDQPVELLQTDIGTQGLGADCFRAWRCRSQNQEMLQIYRQIL